MSKQEETQESSAVQEEKQQREHPDFIIQEVSVTYDLPSGDQGRFVACNLKDKIYLPKGIAEDKEVSILVEYIEEDESETSESKKGGTLKKFLGGKRRNQKTFRAPVKLLQKDKLRKKEREEYPFLKDIDFEELSYAIPELSYADITDREFMGFQEIEEMKLRAEGLWASNGIRKVCIDLGNFCSQLCKESPDLDFEGEFGWREIDTEIQDKLILEECKPCEESLDLFYVNIDTDNLYRYFSKTTKKLVFVGEFSLEISSENNARTFTFVSPLKVVMKHPLMSGDWQEHSVVSIDFGTSSTCVAYLGDEGVRLISLSDNPQSREQWAQNHPEELYEDPYENPTNLAIYNWVNLYRQWNPKNKRTPHPVIGREEKEQTQERKGDYTHGYLVKRNLKEGSARFLNATLTDLKYIPYNMIKRGEEPQFIPYYRDGGPNHVKVAYQANRQDKKTFDPISFYGYLIGRTLNRQISNKLFTNFQLTLPVKFNEEIRKAILNSLEFGLRRALPQPLQQELQIGQSYEEPVAFIGAVREKESFEIGEDGKPAMFAVFDFGGGTIDFSFGIYREVMENEALQAVADEDEKFEYMIEIFGTGGYENMGGEHLIHHISYEIYKENQELMMEHNIPFVVPHNGEKLEFISENLLTATSEASSNVKIINEHISRNFFVHGEGGVKSGKVELVDIHSELTQPLELKLPFAKIEDKLEEGIEELVQEFRKLVEKTFKKFATRLKSLGIENFNLKDVNIFKAGNASKCRWMNKSLLKIFPEFQGENKILFIEEEGISGVRPKTAVAIGALYLDDVGVYDWPKNASVVEGESSNNLEYYIWRKKAAKKYDSVLEKNEGAQSGWRELGKVNPQKIINIYYSENPLSKDVEPKLYRHRLKNKKDLEDFKQNRRTCFVRVHNEETLEYRLLSKKEKDELDPAEETDSSRLVNLGSKG